METGQAPAEQLRAPASTDVQGHVTNVSSASSHTTSGSGIVAFPAHSPGSANMIEDRSSVSSSSAGTTATSKLQDEDEVKVPLRRFVWGVSIPLCLLFDRLSLNFTTGK